MVLGSTDIGSVLEYTPTGRSGVHGIIVMWSCNYEDVLVLAGLYITQLISLSPSEEKCICPIPLIRMTSCRL